MIEIRISRQHQHVAKIPTVRGIYSPLHGEDAVPGILHLYPRIRGDIPQLRRPRVSIPPRQNPRSAEYPHRDKRPRLHDIPTDIIRVTQPLPLPAFDRFVEVEP